MKILLVEDEESIRGFLRINFQRENFQVIECESGEEGVRKALIEKPDIAILDVMLPGMNGFEVCQKLRESFPRMGIIMLTAKGEDMDKIMGLQFGADDYVLKPFNPLEITLRVKALIRRLEGISEENNSDCIEVDNFKLDLYSQSLYKENVEIDVTPKEFLLMKIFMQNPGKAFTRDELLNLLWGIDFFGNSSKPKYIETVWGTGYRWKR